MKESLKVLKECAYMQEKKSQDYQSDTSNVLQAMHYRRGLDTIHDIIIGKITRATSLLESGKEPNFESLEDSYLDLINYASFAVSYMRGKMEGQQPNRDMFNNTTKGEYDNDEYARSHEEDMDYSGAFESDIKE